MQKERISRRNIVAVAAMLFILAVAALLGSSISYGWPFDLAGAPGSSTPPLVAIAPTATPDCSLGLAWRVVSSPNAGAQEKGQTTFLGQPTRAGAASPPAGGETEGGSSLLGLAALAADDVWAVGSSRSEAGIRTLAEHWDGKAWGVVSTMSVGGISSLFNGVAAISPSNVWAVGGYVTQQRANMPLIEHYDGSSWTVAVLPSLGTDQAELKAVSVVAPTDLWATGYRIAGGIYHTLAMHYDGSKWSVVPTPDASPTLNMLWGVSGLSPDDVWAVGYSFGASNSYHALAMHYDGSRWSITTSPNPGTVLNYLYSVAEVSPQEAWAVGYASNGSVITPLLLRWDGKQWHQEQGPALQSKRAELYSVSALRSGEVWVAGMYVDAAGSLKSLLAQKSGTGWTSVASPGSAHLVSTLKAVAAISPTLAWSAGYFDATPGLYSTLVAQYSNPCGK